MRLTRRTLAGIAFVFAPSACAARYEFVTPTCPTIPPARRTSAIAWETNGEARTVAGRVLNLSNAQPLQGAQVRLRVDGRLRITDSLGMVRFESVRSTADTLSVIAINHSPASVILTIPAESGVVFLAAMERQFQSLDGCGTVLEQRRKPWWKIW